MTKKFVNMVTVVCFMTVLAGFMLTHLLLPDRSLSISERRLLQPFPPFRADTLFSGGYQQSLEKYLLDHFPLRDPFRAVKAYSVYGLFAQKDNNRIYLANRHIVKIEYPLREKAIIHAADRFNQIYDAYLQGKDVYYSIIPDKNYYAAPLQGHLALDYVRLTDIMGENFRNSTYIDIFPLLSLDDYYRTDIHWKQERLGKIAQRLLGRMGNPIRISGAHYARQEFPQFYGSYYGQAAIIMAAEVLQYLSDDMLEKAVVYDHAAKTYGKIYDLEALYCKDPYDLFLSGARPLLTIYNPECPEGRELLLFRDSFGSSIAPLLLPGYAKVTLIDLRYVSSQVLADHIDFTQEQDVLFLYNTTILNNSYMLK
jgi:hypothetical protein